MEQLSYEILDLVKRKMREQGAYDEDAYKEYIQETIEYFREKGKLTDEDNDELIEDELVNAWENVKDDLAVEEEEI
ncbi:MAG: hypothetical protein NT091_00735 [Candidatus Falkowbacteria bacterium]|nr:hypothetical protein [Candidatus Falkowbacteria bacterium]